MPAYSMYFTTTASAVVTIEAADEEAAIDAAYGTLPELCASDWGEGCDVDLGEWVIDEDSVQVIGDELE